MGQYFKVVNKTKRQVMCPHKFGSGAKLMEFSSDSIQKSIRMFLLMSFQHYVRIVGGNKIISIIGNNITFKIITKKDNRFV